MINKERRKIEKKLAALPPLDCSGCTECCKGDLIFLLPHEIGVYLSETIMGRQAIQHKPGGDCIYLSPVGCMIHERKPEKCQGLDCRAVVIAAGLDVAKKHMSEGTITAALERLENQIQ